MKTALKTTGWTIVAIAGLAALILAYRNVESSKAPVVFSEKDMLNAIWQRYKDNYLETGTGRTIDRQRGDVTTSEGEGYTMLRAAWVDDHATFDSSWKWTRQNLQFKNGYLFSWLFGKRADGSYGILVSESGQNSASDADTDIATALLFAYGRWRDLKYLEAAQNVIGAIWADDVVEVQGKPYLASDNVEKKFGGSIAVNPSYFAPYSYRMFATIDTGHDWNALVDDSYAVLKESMAAQLDRPSSDGLPPDWMAISGASGSVEPLPKSKSQPNGLKTDFSYDALRVPWRIALDWQWYKDPRAKDILDSMTFLTDQWKENMIVYVDYSHDGAPQPSLVQVPAMYGGTIGAFMAIDPALAKNIYETKLVSMYDPDSDSWKTELDYYDDNWAWFGMALYDGQLPNLWEGVISDKNP